MATRVFRDITSDDPVDAEFDALYLIDCVTPVPFTLPKLTPDAEGKSIRFVLTGSQVAPTIAPAAGDSFATPGGEGLNFGESGLNSLILLADPQNRRWFTHIGGTAQHG